MSADAEPRSGSALLVVLALPVIILSLWIYWATGTLVSRVDEGLGVAVIAALVIPLAIYVGARLTFAAKIVA